MVIGVAIFNDESSVADRKAVCQAVTAMNQSGAMSSIPNDEHINTIIARTPEERDAERDARYQQEWEFTAIGHSLLPSRGQLSFALIFDSKIGYLASLCGTMTALPSESCFEG
jgi:hypothetical protein